MKEVLAEKGMSHRAFAAAMDSAFCGSAMWKHAPSRERLGRVAEILDDEQLEIMAVNDLFWDEVVVDRAGRRGTGLRRHGARWRTTSSPTASPSTTRSSRTPTW